MYLVPASAEPPSRSPGKQKRRKNTRPTASTRALQVQGAEQPRQRDRHAAEEAAVQHRERGRIPLHVGEKGDAGGRLQREAEPARQPTILSRVDTKRCGSLERPGRCGPATVECKRDGQRGKSQAERDEALDQQLQGLALAPPQLVREDAI